MTGSLLTLLNTESLIAQTAAGYWGDETLYAVAARHARVTPNSFAVFKDVKPSAPGATTTATPHQTVDA